MVAQGGGGGAEADVPLYFVSLSTPLHTCFFPRSQYNGVTEELEAAAKAVACTAKESFVATPPLTYDDDIDFSCVALNPDEDKGPWRPWSAQQYQTICDTSGIISGLCHR